MLKKSKFNIPTKLASKAEAMEAGKFLWRGESDAPSSAILTQDWHQRPIREIA